MTGKLKIILGVLGVGILIVLGVVGWVYSQLQPANSADTAQKRFVIAKGQSVIKTAQTLQEAGLIKNAQVFRFYAQYKKLDVNMQAGSYELSPNLTTEQIAEKLTQGSEDIWVTLLEGWRVEEVAEYLAEQDLPEFDATEFAQMADESEGTIFPDSYLVPRESSAEQLYDLFVNTFEKKVLIGLEDEVAASGKDISEVVTLASIVEREGRSFEDMRHVAGILQNRIDLGMPLQADATLQYIAGKDKETGKWWEQPSIEVKKSTSLYNTYMNPDLPPAPICNPGLNAIKAVLDPVPSDDLFYIHTPSGEAYYAETLEEHNANIDKYLR
jgi:UPF0755 protein